MLSSQSPREDNELKGRRTNWMLTQIKQHMHLYGYKLLDIPVIDSADLFLVKAGDQIINSLFTFERHGKQLALRPEFTASAADYFAKTQGSRVARWQFAGPVFEDKSHEFSDNFEQLGIGAELIGLDGSLPEAEIIAMSASGLEKLGVQDIHITIGHIGLVREIIRKFNLDIRTQRFLLHQIPAFNDPQKGSRWILEQFDNQFSALDRSAQQDNFEFSPSTSNTAMGGRTQEDILRRMKLKQQRFADRDHVVSAIEWLDKWCQISGEPTSTIVQLAEMVSDNEIASHLLDEWHNVITLLEVHGIALSSISVKPDLARSWEYYTGIVFDLHSGDIHLGGGGRYDELARLVGSSLDTPSVGFAYYGNQLIGALKDIPTEIDLVITITANEKDMIGATTWANNLRSYGIATQILPASITKTDKAETSTITLENATTALFQTRKYQIEQIDLLINDLKQYR